MADGYALILGRNRETAHRIIDAAPVGSRFAVKPPRRTIPQNDRLWALLGEIAAAKPEGRDYPPAIWKDLFMASAGHQVRWEPALDGNGVVSVGYRSSRLSKEQFSDLFEVIQEYAARHNVEFSHE